MKCARWLACTALLSIVPEARLVYAQPASAAAPPPSAAAPLPSAAAPPPSAAAPLPSAVPNGPPGPLGVGLEALRTSDYAAAEKALASVTGADRPPALLALSRVLFEVGRFDEADAAAEKAGASAPLRATALAARAEVAATRGLTTEAIKLLTRAQAGPGPGGRRARLLLGELLIRAGRRAEAEPLLLKFASDYGDDTILSTDAEGLAMVGRAMFLLRHPKDANRAFNESERAERGRVETLLWRAELFLEKYDPGHAEQTLLEALRVAPHRADANVLLARVKLEEALDFDAAESLVSAALATNPKHVGAYAVRVGVALRDGDHAKAAASLSAGLAVDPSNLELLSLRAASRFLEDDKPGFEAAKRDVFARNREFGQAFAIVGEYAEWEHRYDDVVSMMKEAVALDPQDSKAWAQLGIMQTRAGDETAGIKSLEEAWKGDHFNVRVFNTLERLYGQWIPELYASGSEGVFRIRYPKDERPVLERYVPRMLGEAWGAMKIHYMFAPSSPVSVEMYRDREHFSVRTSGLPNVGIQGVCFGRVVAAMSPKSEPFNWGNVLWHELAHVFAIQISNSHVPRWFTEGLSEYETMIRRPEWQRELDPELYLAIVKKRLPGALEMNAAFTHAQGETDVTVAYYAASQMLAYSAERFGFSGITRALSLWGQGKTTEDVLRGAFGLSPAEYDSGFRSWALARLARYDRQYMVDLRPVPLEVAEAKVASTPLSADAEVALAGALLGEHRAEDAGRAVEAALRFDPNNKDAHFFAAKLATLRKDGAAAGKHLEAIKALAGDGYAVEMGLSELAGARRDPAAERSALEAAHRFDPSQVEPLHALYDRAVEEKRPADALEALRAIARLDQHDRKAWRLLLASLVAAKRWDEAVKVGDGAVYVDVESASIHMDYARALSETGDHEAAAYELESALLCEAPPKESARAHALLARERLALGDMAGARAHRDAALRLDPATPDVKGF